MQALSFPSFLPPQAEPVDRAVHALESRLTATGPPGGVRREDLRRAAEEFESLFVAYLFKVMRETLDEGDSQETVGFGKAIYTELFDQEVSRTVARRGAFGIADMIMRNFQSDGATSSPAIPSAPVSSAAPTPAQGDCNETEVPDAMLPVRSPVNSGFGFRRDPFTRGIRFHKGLDIAAPEGTAVQAVSEGEVVFAGSRPGYGNLVIARHAGGLETRYAHLSRISVKTGDRIRAQQLVGEVGHSGRSTGPHLHFEVVRRGVHLDPREVLGQVFSGSLEPPAQGTTRSESAE